ncbi:MAG: cytochrome c oxidase subunit II [Actinobacteria bacterium]|nr:cytochrome c oxidase subunit II [Actinomycetota bacterium]
MADQVESLVEHGNIWFPDAAGSMATKVDFLYSVTMWVSVVIFVAMFLVGLYFVIKYKRSAINQKAESHVTDNVRLELAWSFIPFVLLMILFAWSFRDYLDLVIAPPDAQEIKVVAKKWLWEVEYPELNMKALNEIVVPVSTPIKLTMTATDVLHSLFIPNFRVKRDIIPNRYSTLWFEAIKPGVFQLFCTEFCGDGHSEMIGIVRVLSEPDYQEWLLAGSEDESIPLDELGKKLYVSKACNTCHSIDGTDMVGPTWKGLFNSDRNLQSGEVVTADDNYIRESIVYPQVKLVSGYQPVMPAYAGLLSDRDIDGIIAYIKTLK